MSGAETRRQTARVREAVEERGFPRLRGGHGVGPVAAQAPSYGRGGAILIFTLGSAAPFRRFGLPVRQARLRERRPADRTNGALVRIGVFSSLLPWRCRGAAETLRVSPWRCRGAAVTVRRLRRPKLSPTSSRRRPLPLNRAGVARVSPRRHGHVDGRPAAAVRAVASYGVEDEKPGSEDGRHPERHRAP